MTVSPDGFISEESGEFIQTGHTVEGSQVREQLRAEETHNQEERFIVDPETGDTSYDNSITNDEYQHIVDSYGGPEVYSQVSEWAAGNFSSDDVEGFNAIIDSGDINEISAAVEKVYRLWEDRLTDGEPPSLDLDTAEDTDAAFVFSEIIPESEYNNLIEFAANTYDDEFISQYNSVMESGNREMIRNTVNLLRNKFNENN